MKTLPPLTTTVIGSYPVNGNQGLDAVKYAVKKQIEAGVEIVSDGQTRTDMIRYFTGHIPGFSNEGDMIKIVDFISPPISSPIVDDLKFAKKIINDRAELKGIVTGPVTLIASSKIEKSSGYRNFLDRKLYEDLAEALRKEVDFFLNLGVCYVQIDEPFYSVGVPLDLASEAIRILTEGVRVPVGLHVCGDTTKVFGKLISFSGIDILSLEFKGSPQNFTVINQRKLEKAEKMLGVGCVDSKTNDIEPISEIERVLNKALKLVGGDNIVVHPDCGLRLLDSNSAYLKLKNMVEAVKNLREKNV